MKAQQKYAPKRKSRPLPTWQAVINFVPFSSEQERDRAYENWVELYLRGKARKKI